MIRIYFISFLMIYFISCDNDSKTKKKTIIPITEGATNLVLSDVSNLNDGRDLQLSFTGAEDESQIIQYRIYLRIDEFDEIFDLDKALSIVEGNYKTVSPGKNTYSLKFEETTKDIDGRIIETNKDYEAFVLTEMKKEVIDTNYLSIRSNTVKLTSVTELTKNIFADDKSNNHDASDIYVSFDKATNENLVSSYRVYFIKTTDLNILEQPANVLNLTEGKYTSVQLNENLIEPKMHVYFNPNTTDIDLNPFETNTEYAVLVATIADGIYATENVLNTDYDVIRLTINNYLESFTDTIQIGTGGLTMSPDNILYASHLGQGFNNADGRQLFKIEEDGSYSIWRNDLSGGAGSVIDNDGNIYQTNYNSNKVTKIPLDDEGFVLEFGSILDGIDKPMDVYFDENDETIYVTNFGTDTIIQIDQDIEASIFYGNEEGYLNGSNGLVRDENGNFYVSNYNDGNIVKINTDKEGSIFATLPGLGNGQMVYSNQAIYVAARNANKIFKIDLNGAIKLIAGTGELGFSNGSGLNSDLSAPFGLALSNDGKYLYFNEVVKPTSLNNLSPMRIRRIVLDEENID